MSQIPVHPIIPKPMPLHPVAPAPTVQDFISALFTGSPLLPSALYMWVGFVRETGLFIILDATSFLYDATIPNAPKASAGFIASALGLQVLYIVANLLWRALRAAKSPLAPIFGAGVLFIDDLITRSGGTLPDISREPSLPPTGGSVIAPVGPVPIVLGVSGVPVPLIPGDPTPTPPPPGA
jgi:hypothetical protein